MLTDEGPEPPTPADVSNRLPTLHHIVERLADRLEQQSLVGVLVFDASDLDAFEHRPRWTSP